MNIFTEDQKQRMRAVLEGSPLRLSLINSDACTPPNPSDASITDIFAPTGDNCVGTITPSVQLRNRGSNNLTSATISYRIDNGAVTTFAWTGTIVPGANATVALPGFSTTLGPHTFKSYSTVPNGVVDPFPGSDTSQIDFVVSNGIMPNFTEDFEAGSFPPDNRWNITNGGNTCFRWTPASGVSSTGVLTNNIAQMPCYGNGNTADIEDFFTPIFLVPCNATALSLSFDVAYRKRVAGSNDRLQVQISTDCGATWTTIYNKSGTSVAPNDLATNATLTGTTEYFPAISTDWRNENLNLISYVSGTSDQVRFRFRGTSNNGNNIFIDNVRFQGTTPGEINVLQTSTDILDGGYSTIPSTQVGNTTNVTYTVQNTGTTNLVLTNPITVTGTGIALVTGFGTTTVAPGGSTTFTISYTPAAVGSTVGNVSFATNDCDEGTYNFALNCTGTQNPPVANFTANPLSSCAGTTVTFTNTSTNATSYSWNFGPNATPTTSTATNPTVTFLAGTHTITLTATNGFGSDGETKTNYITALAPGGGVLPIVEGFVTATTIPANWSILNTNSSATTWARATTAGIAPTAGNSMRFDNYNFADADDDQLRVQGFSLNGYTSATMTFDVAYRIYDATWQDGLEVLVSTDCGNTFTSVYNKFGTVLATVAGNQTTPGFVPTAAQWRNETVSLTPYINNPNVIVAFRNLSGNGQFLYIDNVNISGVLATATANFTMAPNPVCQGQTVTFTNTSTGATSYSWNFGAGATPATATTAGPHTVTYSTSGSKTVTLQINGTGPTSTQNLTVNALPATPTITAGGAT
ncbi:MAG: PKD domain-containing protein, partial [Fluviicola sp.]